MIFKNKPRMMCSVLALCLVCALVSCAPKNTVPKDTLMPSEPPAEEESSPSAAPSETYYAPENTPDVYDTAAQSILQSMSVEEKIYQLFIVAPEQILDSDEAYTHAEDSIQAAFQSRPVGGVILFSDNIKTPEQVTEMILDMQAGSRLGIFVAVDEEGGAVARLAGNKAMGTTAFPPMGDIGASGNTENARNVGLTIGSDMKRFGFNLDFAPVADVNSNPNNPVIANRAFSSDPEIAADMVAACVSGFRESGVLCTLKHFPGHGDTETDSHYGAAVSNKTIEELRSCEFLPFISGIEAGADMVMVGHISLPNVTGDDTPACLSHRIISDILRDELGFDGLTVTDSMSMKAITERFSAGDAAVRALSAGVDIILMPDDLDEAAAGIASALESGEISETRLNESVYRILYIKLLHGIIPMPDQE